MATNDSGASGFSGNLNTMDWTKIGNFLDQKVPGFRRAIVPVMQAIQAGEDIPDGCLLTVRDDKLVTQYDYSAVKTGLTTPP